MKYLILLMTFLALTSCAVNMNNYKVPEGYRPCRFDGDCHHGERCGFVGVDTYPVCKPLGAKSVGQ